MCGGRLTEKGHAISTDRHIEDLDPALRPLAQKFLDQCQASGIKAILIETYRSSEKQDEDYAQGRTTPGRVITDAQGGQSPHNCCLPDGQPAARAFDFALYDPSGAKLDWNTSDASWKTAIQVGKGLGLVSGSTFPGKLCDYDHMELEHWKAGAIFGPQETSEDV